eukprot:1273523-Pyramimonas_sp.AAC.1
MAQDIFKISQSGSAAGVGRLVVVSGQARGVQPSGRLVFQVLHLLPAPAQHPDIVHVDVAGGVLRGLQQLPDSGVLQAARGESPGIFSTSPWFATCAYIKST